MFDLNLSGLLRIQLPASDQFGTAGPVIAPVDTEGHRCFRLVGVGIRRDAIPTRDREADAHVVGSGRVGAAVEGDECVVGPLHGVAAAPKFPLEPHPDVGMVPIVDYARLGVRLRSELQGLVDRGIRHGKVGTQVNG